MHKSLILSLGALALFAVSLYISASQPFPHWILDEHGHYSYTRYLSNEHRFWPNFGDFPLLRTDGERIIGQDNFINHPPLFYWLSSWLGLETPAALRGYAWLFYALAIAGYFLIGMRAGMTRVASLLYALFPFLMSVEWIIGYYSNDAWATLGGICFTYGSLRWLNSPKPTTGFAWMGIGLFFAAAKMTGFLLVLFYAAGIWLLSPHKRRTLHFNHYALSAAFIFILSLPYLYFLAIWGSPTPNSPGQVYMLKSSGPSLPFHVWLSSVLLDFGTTASAKSVDLVAIGIVMLLLSWVITIGTRSPSPLQTIARAACMATFAMLIIHIWFSYDRFVRYKWIRDFYARYYLPLLAPYALSVARATMLLIHDACSRRLKTAA